MQQSTSLSTNDRTQSVAEVNQENEGIDEMQQVESQQGTTLQQTQIDRISGDNEFQNQAIQMLYQGHFVPSKRILQELEEDSSFNTRSQHDLNLDSSIDSNEIKNQIFQMDIDFSGLYSAFFSSDLVEYKYKEALVNALKVLKYNRENNQQNSFENVNILFKIGQIFLSTSQYKNSLEYFEKAERIYKQLFSHEYYFGAGLYNKFALSYCQLSQFDVAKEKIKLATKCYERLQGKEKNQKKAQSLYILGIISYDKFKNSESLKNALDYFHESQKLYKQLNDGRDKSGQCFKIYNAIGGVHFYRGEYKESGQYYEKTIHIGKHIYKGTNQYPLAKILSNFATVLVKLGDLPRAQHYLLEANEIFKNLKIEDQVQNAGLSFNFCNLHEMKGDYTLALKFCEQSEKMLLKLVDQKNIYVTEARQKLKVLRQKIAQQQQSSKMSNSQLNSIVSIGNLSVQSQN